MIIEIYIIFPTTFFTLPPTISSKTTFFALNHVFDDIVGGFSPRLVGFHVGSSIVGRLCRFDFDQGEKTKTVCGTSVAWSDDGWMMG